MGCLEFQSSGGLGESGVRPRRSLRQKRMKQENEVARLIFKLANYILKLKYLYRYRHKWSYRRDHMVVNWKCYKKDHTLMPAKGC